MPAILIGAVAVFVRVCNLGTFSLWLDEVKTMQFASLPMLEAISACAADADNVPVYVIITRLCLLLGLEDPWIRFVPIVAGAASIAFLAIWTDRHFGRTTALLVAAFCALSPFHIRTSQELRAYPYLILVCTATLLVVDRLRADPGWKTTLGLAAVVATGFYTSLSYGLILVPMTGFVFLDRISPQGDRANGKEACRQYVAGVALGLLAFVPWMVWVWTRLSERLSRPRTTVWDLHAIAQRWEALTVASWVFSPWSWFGLVLAGFFVVGLIAALKTGVGRFVFLPALAALVGWEFFLVAIEHWSAARYDTALWPFLAVLLALGFGTFLLALRWRWLGWLACLGIAVMLFVRVDAYHRVGRPHWDRLAQAVNEVRRPGETVVTVDQFARTCLSYYLDEPVVTVNARPERLRRLVRNSSPLLLVSRRHLEPAYLNVPAYHAKIADVHRTGRLYRFNRWAVASGEREGSKNRDSWPEPLAAPISPEIERLPSGCFGRPFRHLRATGRTAESEIDFAPTDRHARRSGWEQPKTRANGVTAAWVRGREARVDIGLEETSRGPIRIRLWPHRDLSGAQSVRVLLNGHVLGVRQLTSGPQVVSFDVPNERWTNGRDLLVLQFTRSRCEGTARCRSAAVDWIRGAR
ncbi:MAG: glycosyltransferase family 39 protein [Acidobacteriota bacterium]